MNSHVGEFNLFELVYQPTAHNVHCLTATAGGRKPVTLRRLAECFTQVY